MNTPLYYDSTYGMVPVEVIRHFRDARKAPLKVELEVVEDHYPFKAGERFETLWLNVMKYACDC